MKYEMAKKRLREARDSGKGKPIGNNTRLFDRGDHIAIRLHATDIVRIYPDDSVSLHSDGWKTVTTKERMNRFTNAGIHSIRGTWYVRGGALYADGMRLYADGTVTGAAEPSSMDKEKQLRKRAKKYAKDFIDALFAGKVAVPSCGDCWGCCMRANDGAHPLGGADHILSHFEDSYFVPSLLAIALENSSQAARQTAWAYMEGKQGYGYAYTTDRNAWLVKNGIEKYVYKHCLRQLGMAV